MSRHRGCITDRLTKVYWRDYQSVIRDGNPMGVSFVEYVAARCNAEKQMGTYTGATDVPWYLGACGHSHPWGGSCATWTMT